MRACVSPRVPCVSLGLLSYLVTMSDAFTHSFATALPTHHNMRYATHATPTIHKPQPRAALSRRAIRRKRGDATQRRNEQNEGLKTFDNAATLGGAAALSKTPRQPFRYLAVVDVEATCERGSRPYVHEIIELPVVLVDLETLERVDEFHSYVRPTINTTLTEFCVKLTGITQAQVDAAPTLDVVLLELDGWLRERGLCPTPDESPHQRQFAFGTDGPWDLNYFLDGECRRKAIPKPLYFDKWVNLKQTFADHYKTRRCKIHKMLELQGMRFEGRLHSGIDDSRNIARIAIKMARDGATLYINEGSPPRRAFQSL